MCTNGKFSMSTLMEEVKPTYVVKYEFEHLEKSKIISSLWNFSISGLWCKGEKQGFLVEYSSESAVFLIELSKKEIEPVVAKS